MKTNRKERGPRVTKFSAKGRWWFYVAMFCAASVARGDLLLQDSFNYASGNLSGQGSWTNSGAGTPIQVQSGNLSYSGLPPSAGSELTLNGSGANAFSLLSSTVSSGSVYCSFLIELTGPPTLNSYVASLGDGAGRGWELGFMTANGTNFSCRYGGSYLSPYVNLKLNVGNTYLVVGRYNFVPGANNDTANLWVNPSSSTFGNANPPAPDVTVSLSYMADPVSSIDRFTWLNSSPNVVVDELRVGTSWADVTQVPEPSSWNFMAAGVLLFFAARRWVHTVGSSRRIGKNNK